MCVREPWQSQVGRLETGTTLPRRLPNACHQRPSLSADACYSHFHLSGPEPLTQRTQTDGGQGCRGDGRIDKRGCGWGNGNRSRRRSNVRKSSESIRVAQLVGKQWWHPRQGSLWQRQNSLVAVQGWPECLSAECLLDFV